MRLETLEIQTLSGIEPGFRLTGISPGTTLVTGPNAVGKSSLVRAIRSLLGADSGSDTAIALSAVFINGGRWTVRRTGSQLVWEQDGRPVEAPALPDADSLGCYLMSMESLLDKGANDEQLIADLRRTMAGGFDLPALHKDLAPRTQIGQRESRALREAEKELRATEDSYRALRRDEQRLPKLEQSIARARAASGDAVKLQHSLGLAEILRERAEIEAGHSSFAADMEKLRGDELQRVDVLQQEIAEHRADLTTTRQRKEDELAKLTATGLADGQPARSDIDAESERLTTMLRLADQIADRRRELERACAKEISARSALGDGHSSIKLTPDQIERAESVARELKSKELRQDELIARIDNASEMPTEGEIFGHSKAIETLRDWLAAKSLDVASRKWPLWLISVASFVALGASAITGMWFIAASSLMTFVAAAWLLWKTRGRLTGIRSRFQEGELPEPDDWTLVSVKSRLAEIERSLAGLLLNRERATAAEGDRLRLSRLEQELDALHEKRRQLASELGFDPKLTATSIDHFARRANDWQVAADDVSALNLAIKRLEAEFVSALQTIGKFLAKWGFETNADPESTAATLQELQANCRIAESAVRNMQEADRDAQRIATEIERKEEQKTGIFAEAGLEHSQRDMLTERLERLDAWKRQRERLADVERREAEARERLAEEPELIKRAEVQDAEELGDERDLAQQQASELESLQEERTAIQTRLTDAGADNRLERALAAVSTSRSALEDCRDDQLMSEASRFLLEDVEAEHRNENEPEVLRLAREKFQLFTHHAWDLELDDEHGIMARDLTLKARRSMNELSSGTKMQLLLAMRLGWIRHLERDRVMLPLFLDEALTTADESRFGAIAKSLNGLATEGRQIFYLSARRQELSLWEHVTGSRPHHLDLAAVRFGAKGTMVPDLSLPESEQLPSPEDRKPEEYAEALGISLIDPREPEGGTPLFHLLRDDLFLLHELMNEWRVTTLGQAESLLKSSAAKSAISDSGQRQLLADRCVVARAWIQAWRQGRGRPVDRLALEASKAISPTFLDRTAELADKIGGNAAQLIGALREGQIPRFRANNIDDLETWLSENRFLDAANMLDLDGRLRSVLQKLGHQISADRIRELTTWLEAAKKLV